MGKSPCLVGKGSINGDLHGFAIATFDDQRVHLFSRCKLKEPGRIPSQTWRI